MDLKVKFDGQEIIVTKPGTDFLLAYCKRPDSPNLVLTRKRKTPRMGGRRRNMLIANRLRSVHIPTASNRWQNMADTKKPSDAEDHRLPFHFRKSSLFRVIHADGAYGGISPNGNIHFALYNERFPIPKITSRGFTKDGRLNIAVPEASFLQCA
jgi:hypothetical protein